MNTTDRHSFQLFLDDQFDGITAPISKSTPTEDELRRTSEIITHYARFRHNDWSEEWIRANLSKEALGTYEGWVDDLVTICRSHHEGYAELRQERFKPRLVGSPATVFQLRYVAVILRVADILEFDPERTPFVLFKHRTISPSSLIYWYKDHQVSMALENGRIMLAARPTSATMHRAIELMADSIDEELSIAKKLSEETYFEKCPGMPKPTKHRWDLLPSVYRQIEPLNERYEYINGAFRPDSGKLLEILSGVQLYGSPIDAVRELVQNALDAVNIQIAYERLNRADAADAELATLIGKLHFVDLRLELSSDGPCLTCKDTGVGMTKAIIRDRVLVSGSGKKHEIRELQRRCAGAGFRLVTTGQFGIGILSYFMLANRLIMKTRRSPECGGIEPGWAFETDGVGSFGELRRDASLAKGTEIYLYLRTHALSIGLQGFYRQLRGYLIESLRYLPCNFCLSSAIPGCETLTLGPGWTQLRAIELSALPSGKQRGPGKSLIPLAEELKRDAESSHWKQVSGEAEKSLKWLVESGELPDGLGRFRIHIPFYEVGTERLLAFIRYRTEGALTKFEPIGKGYVFVPRGTLHMSWRGISPVASARYSRVGLVPQFGSHAEFMWHGDSADTRFGTGSCEVNWESPEAGEIAVNRHSFDLSEKATKALQWLADKAQTMKGDFLRNPGGQVFSSLNHRVLERTPTDLAQFHWFERASTNPGSESNDLSWKRQQLPFTSATFFEEPPMVRLRWNGKDVAILPSMRKTEDDDDFKGVAWHTENSAPDRFVLCPKVWVRFSFKPEQISHRREKPLSINEYFLSYKGLGNRTLVSESETVMQVRMGIIPLWTDTPGHGVRPSPWGLECRFPPNWTNICGIAFEGYGSSGTTKHVWNPSHALIRWLDLSAWKWARSAFVHDLNPLPQRDQLLVSPSRAAAWVLRCLLDKAHEIWDALPERDPLFLPNIWRILFPDSAPSSPHIYGWRKGAAVDCGR